MQARWTSRWRTSRDRRSPRTALLLFRDAFRNCTVRAINNFSYLQIKRERKSSAETTCRPQHLQILRKHRIWNSGLLPNLRRLLCSGGHPNVTFGFRGRSKSEPTSGTYPKKPRKPKPASPPLPERIEVPYILVPHHRPLDLSLSGRTFGKRWTRSSWSSPTFWRSPKNIFFHSGNVGIFFYVILLWLNFKEIFGTDVTLSERNRITHISEISFIPRDFVMDGSVFDWNFFHIIKHGKSRGSA
jgi:hypothetical protein